MKKYEVKDLEESEKKWIETVLRMEGDDFEKLDYLICEGFDIGDIVEVAIDIK